MFRFPRPKVAAVAIEEAETAAALRNLARDRQLAVYRHEGFWHPMDTYRDYLHLNEMWRNDPTWRIWK